MELSVFLHVYGFACLPVCWWMEMSFVCYDLIESLFEYMAVIGFIWFIFT